MFVNICMRLFSGCSDVFTNYTMTAPVVKLSEGAYNCHIYCLGLVPGLAKHYIFYDSNTPTFLAFD